MSTFAFIHGAGDVGWYWHLVEADLRAHGHTTVAPDLPIENDQADLGDYADVVVEAISGRSDVVVVGSPLDATLRRWWPSASTPA